MQQIVLENQKNFKILRKGIFVGVFCAVGFNVTLQNMAGDKFFFFFRKIKIKKNKK